MPIQLPLQEFLKSNGKMFDVRSPSEFQQGHIPQSFSTPLFSDSERALIGTTYKQIHRNAAIDLGLKIVGPKLFDLVQSIKIHSNEDPCKILCWRGGMRSGFVAAMLESIGFSSVTLQGGYKSFRRWTLKSLENLHQQTPTLFVLGGLTGSGKTSVLHELKQFGEQVLDLENLAQHRGSAFGKLGLPTLITQEHFENQIAFLWNQFDLSRPIWIEDESKMIGKCCIPNGLYSLMKNAPLFYMEIDPEKRIDNLLNSYGLMNAEDLIRCALALQRKLGSQLTCQIISLFEQNRKKEAFILLLSYYDKCYLHQLKSKRNVTFLKNSYKSDREFADNLRNEIPKGN